MESEQHGDSDLGWIGGWRNSRGSVLVVHTAGLLTVAKTENDDTLRLYFKCYWDILGHTSNSYLDRDRGRRPLL